MRQPPTAQRLRLLTAQRLRLVTAQRLRLLSAQRPHPSDAHRLRVPAAVRAGAVPTAAWRR